MTTSESLFARALKVAPGGVHSPVRAFKSVGGTPIFFTRGEGAYLYSVEGERYIDFCQSFGPNILGHRDPDVEQVLKETVELGWCFGACEPYSLDLAEYVIQQIPWIEKIRFVCSGTEAVMSALRVARAATGREKVLKFEGCYHGHADSMLVKAGSGLAGVSSSDSAGVSEALAAETLTCPLDDENAIAAIFKIHGHNIAAVILEPLPANYGLLVQRPEFIARVCEIAHGHGALVIFDEVISGFRAAFGGMAECLGLKPDLITFGKILGGGLAVGAYAGSRRLMDQVAPAGRVYQAGTLSANPLAMRCGLATLQKLKRDSVHEILKARTNQFVLALREMIAPAGFDVTAFASVFWIHPNSLVPLRSLTQLPSGLGERYRNFFHALIKHGVYMAPSGYEVGFVSLAHTDEVLSDALGRIAEAVRELV